MDSLMHDYVAGVFNTPHPPCLSLYQPTSRMHPGNQQDPIRFRNQLRALEQSLGREYGKREVGKLLKPFNELADDGGFWNHTLDGLAVLASPQLFKVYRLQRPVPELSIVADSFHIRPLIRILQSADRFQILSLNRQEIALYEGNRDGLDRVDLPSEVPQTITDALGELEPEPQVMIAPHITGPNRAGRHYGHGAKPENVDSDTERFFRAVDRAILEHCSRPSGLPLLLASLPEHHHIFRRVSRNPFLMEQTLDTHPDALSMEELRQRAWQVMEPYYLARTAALVDMYNAGRPRGLSADNLQQVAVSAVAGRVAMLLVEADRVIPGRIDPATGEIHQDELAKPNVDDLLDDLAELVLKNGGQVVVLPSERMPSKTGIAALYRF
jgi:hypothetical protein